MIPGYAGKILRVNLSTKKAIAEPLNAVLVKDFIGGKGLGAKILYDEVKPGTDPLSPENKLIIATGPLTGTRVPLASRYSIITKSPLTGAFLDCSMSGSFGAELKYAGYDAIIVEGRSEGPTCIYINNENIEIKDATFLWGKDTHETKKMIIEEVDDETVETFVIGPAGENLVRYASIMGDVYRCAGRGGVGAVMGSKNLKGISVKGTGSIEVADAKNLERRIFDLYEFIRRKSGWLRRFHEQGSLWLMESMNALGILPTRNFQSGVFEFIENINNKAVRRYLSMKNVACFACPLSCVVASKVKVGPDSGISFVGPEYDAFCMLGPNCGLDSLETIIKACFLCDTFGLDAISAGSVMAFAMECYEKGIISNKDTGGINLHFGEEGQVLEFLEMICRRKGFGDLLASGVNVIAKKFGRNSKEFALQIKGLEVPPYDPRGIGSIGLAYATSDVGADYPGVRLIEEELAGNLTRFSLLNSVELVAVLQNEKMIMDSIGVCDRIGLFTFAEVFSFVTGQNIDLVYSETYPALVSDLVLDGRSVVRKICNLCRAFNVREGFTRRDDKLPERFNEPLLEGPSKGKCVRRKDFQKALDEYYRLRGWDRNGVPIPSRALRHP